MRYLIVTYIQRAAQRRGGRSVPAHDAPMQQDEQVQMSRRLHANDISTGSVILDFKTREVIKSSVGDQVAPRDFALIRDYYRRHYPDLIDELERNYAEAPQ